MTAPSEYLDTADLKAVTKNGLVNEDVLQKIFDISDIPTPFLNMVRKDTCKNSYTEWTTDELAAPDVTNAVVSGSDASGNNASTGARVGNHTQISDKVVAVTERARHTDSIGRSDELAYQVARRLQELRRDVEAIALTHQESRADNNDSTAGLSAGFGAWLTDNDFLAGGTATGFNTSTGVVAAPSVGTQRVLAESLVRDAVEAVYLDNGNVTTMMSRPELVRQWNTWLNSSSSSFAAASANIPGQGMGVSQTAQGYFSVMITDFGTTLTIVPNRLQQAYTDDSSNADTVNVYFIDPTMVGIGYLYGYKVDDLAKLGLSDRKLLSVDWTLKVYNQKAHAVIRDVDMDGAVVSAPGA